MLAERRSQQKNVEMQVKIKAAEHPLMYKSKWRRLSNGASSSFRNASEDQAAEHQAHVEIQVKIKQEHLSSCRHPSEDQAAKNQVHVELQMGSKQRSIHFMYKSKWRLINGASNLETQVKIKQRSRHQVHVEMLMKIKQRSISACGNASEDRAAEHQAHVEMPTKIKEEHQVHVEAAEHQVHVEIQVKIKQEHLSSCRHPSEDQAAKNQVHVELQVRSKQRSIHFMYKSKWRLSNGASSSFRKDSEDEAAEPASSSCGNADEDQSAEHQCMWKCKWRSIIFFPPCATGFQPGH